MTPKRTQNGPQIDPKTDPKSRSPGIAKGGPTKRSILEPVWVGLSFVVRCLKCLASLFQVILQSAKSTKYRKIQCIFSKIQKYSTRTVLYNCSSTDGTRVGVRAQPSGTRRVLPCVYSVHHTAGERQRRASLVPHAPYNCGREEEPDRGAEPDPEDVD